MSLISPNDVLLVDFSFFGFDYYTLQSINLIFRLAGPYLPTHLPLKILIQKLVGINKYGVVSYTRLKSQHWLALMSL